MRRPANNVSQSNYIEPSTQQSQQQQQQIQQSQQPQQVNNNVNINVNQQPVAMQPQVQPIAQHSGDYRNMNMIPNNQSIPMPMPMPVTVPPQMQQMMQPNQLQQQQQQLQQIQQVQQQIPGQQLPGQIPPQQQPQQMLPPNMQQQYAVAAAAYYGQQAVFIDQNGQPVYYRVAPPNGYQPEIMYTNPDGSPADPMQIQQQYMNMQGMQPPNGYWPQQVQIQPPEQYGNNNDPRRNNGNNMYNQVQNVPYGMPNTNSPTARGNNNGPYGMMPQPNGNEGYPNNREDNNHNNYQHNQHMNQQQQQHMNHVNQHNDYRPDMMQQRYGYQNQQQQRNNNNPGGGYEEHYGNNGRQNGRNNQQRKQSPTNGNQIIGPPLIRDPLVEEFRTTFGKTRQWSLRDLAGHVVPFCQDQHGSRFIQQRLEICSDSEKQVVFDEIMPTANLLMTDVFGNYVLQKLFEFGASEQCDMLSSLLIGQCVTLSMQMYGCRVVQKALEYVTTPRLVLLINEFENPEVINSIILIVIQFNCQLTVCFCDLFSFYFDES